MNDTQNAIKLLRDNEIPVEARSYGFSLQHDKLAGCDFAQCGFDNDSSISLSVTLGETSPVHWFFRISFGEMAEFITAAYQATKGLNPSRDDIIKSMCTLDETYDDTELNKMAARFVTEIESDMVMSTNIVPKNKHDFKTCAQLSKASDAEVIANLDELLGWTADVNWPVASHVIDRLKSLGNELVLPLKKLLAGEDDTWKYSLIAHLLPVLREDVFSHLESDLQRIISNPTASEILEEVYLEAKELAVKKKLIG